MYQCSDCCIVRERIMDDEPLHHEALLNSLCAIDRACELARRQVQGLFPVPDICMTTCPNKFRPQDLTSKNSHDSSNNRTVSEQCLILTENNSSPTSKAFIVYHSPLYTTVTDTILYPHPETGNRNNSDASRDRNVIPTLSRTLSITFNSIHHLQKSYRNATTGSRNIPSAIRHVPT